MFLGRMYRTIRKEEPNPAVKDSNVNHQVEENTQGKTLDREKPDNRSNQRMSKL